MAINTVKAPVNGEEITLTLNQSTGKYEATVTAPNKSTNSSEVPGGYFPVTITATDTAGNSTTVNPSDSTFGNSLKLYVKEQVKPTISITSPTAGAYNISDSQTITFTTVDNANGRTSGYSGIDKSSISVTVDCTPITSITYTDITGVFRGSVTKTLDAGSHTITVNGSDKDGNAAVAKSVTFTVDTVITAHHF